MAATAGPNTSPTTAIRLFASSDRPEGRPGEDDDGTDAQRGERGDDRAALGAGLVDRGADRRLDREPEQAADRGHQSDLGLRSNAAG